MHWPLVDEIYVRYMEAQASRNTNHVSLGAIG